jgi:hypothetical protein
MTCSQDSDTTLQRPSCSQLSFVPPTSLSVEVYPEQTPTVQKCVYTAVASFPVEHAIRYTAQYGCQGDPVAWHVPVGAGVSCYVFRNSTGGWGRKVI